MSHIEEIYERAQKELGPEKGCYIPPKMLENHLGESLAQPG